MPASAGVTRRSVIALLEDMGYTVKEEEIPIDQALDADEVFTTGTAVVVSSVGSLTYEGALVVTGVAWTILQQSGTPFRVGDQYMRLSLTPGVHVQVPKLSSVMGQWGQSQPRCMTG